LHIGFVVHGAEGFFTVRGTVRTDNVKVVLVRENINVGLTTKFVGSEMDTNTPLFENFLYSNFHEIPLLLAIFYFDILLYFVNFANN
jgi:hypothetical protein